MPVMPAPTTSTSVASLTFLSKGDRALDALPRMLYRPVGYYSVLDSALREGEGRYGDRGPEVVGPPGALCDGAPGPGSQRALLRSRLLQNGSRPVVASGLADGVPARGDPPAA